MPTAWNNDEINHNIPKIAVCVPYNGNWNPEWIERTYIPLLYKPVSWCQKIAFLCRVPSISVARDILVKQALKTNCDYVFFIDSDNIFEEPSDPNDALKQLYQRINKNKYEKNSKIVSGLYRAKKPDGFNYAMWMKHKDEGFAPIVKWQGNWLEVDVAGMGCCLVDTEVFKSLPRPLFKWDEADEISEDFYFYQLAKKNGYDTHIFTDVKLSHLGNVKIKCDGTIVSHDI